MAAVELLQWRHGAWKAVAAWQPGQSCLLRQRAGRRRQGPVPPGQEIATQPAVPAGVEAVGPAVVVEQRVIAIAVPAVTAPRPEAQARVGRAEVAPVVVAAAVWAAEQRGQQPADAEDTMRAVAPAGILPERLVEADGGEQQAAVGQGVIPIAADVGAPGRRPRVAGRVPYPVRMAGRPEARPPDIARGSVHPAARLVDAVDVRLRHARAVVQ